MTKAEIAKLLTFIAAWDRRTVGEMDVEAWHAAATLAKWRVHHAKQAATMLLATGKPGIWLSPAHVTEHIAEVRRDVSKRLFTRSIEPPRELGGDVAAEMRWRRETVPALVEKYLDEWATTGELPAPTNELERSSPEGQARLAELLGRDTFALPAATPAPTANGHAVAAKALREAQLKARLKARAAERAS